MKWAILVVVVLGLSAAQPRATGAARRQAGSAAADAAAAELAAAKALYASASYEEALARLGRLDGASASEQAELYRALCFLALNRTAEAQQSLERLALHSPLYAMSDDDVSPRLVQMFHDVRARLLPRAARDLFTKAKASFEQQKFAQSLAQLKDVLAIIADRDVANQAAENADLKLLAEGFTTLVNSEIAAAAKAAANPPPPPPAPVGPPPPPKVYSLDDKDVQPPTDVSKDMPPWLPPDQAIRGYEYRGLLEVIIDEKGAVESAQLRTAPSKGVETSIIGKALQSYEAGLLNAAKAWRFQPAMRYGTPVKFATLIGIVLKT